MDRYTEKCLGMLSTKQFTVVKNDPTKTLESKIQRILKKSKSKITDQEYNHLYPARLQPEKFYGTAKIHELPVNGNLNHLPVQTLVSNINTSTHNLAKFLSKVLSLLHQWDHVRSTKDFFQNIKRENIKTGYKMISFDVVII